MDINKYINSGILENYVLGLVSETEAKKVERNLIQYPELKVELNKIEDALEVYAQAQAKPMPAGLSATILQSIQDLESSPSSTSDTTTASAKPQAAIPKSNNTLGIVLGIALLGSLLGNLLLTQQKQDLQAQLTQTQTQVSDINDRMVTLQLNCDERIQRLQEQLAILKNPAYKPISLKGTDNAPNAIAIVYFNPEENKSYLDIGNLPPTPSDKDYQLWAIVDGAPTDMGLFDLTTAVGGLVEVPHIQNPQAFAITLETKGGNPSPNLEELYVIGNV